MAASRFSAAELDEATALLQSLIRIDTSNPPGREAEAVAVLADRIRRLGLEPVLAGEHPERLNLVARFPADPALREGRPLVLSCHLDCVPADPARWSRDPWSGENDGTCVWGRGAIDMKGFAAMAFAVFARLARERFPVRRDVIFAAVADEEAGTRLGSRWLVDERPDLLGGDPEYVLNEVGGFTVHRKGRRFYPVQVAEKGVAWLRLTVRGKPGHSSLPSRDPAVGRLARAVDAISRAKLPWHPSPEARAFVGGFAEPQGPVARTFASWLCHPLVGPVLLPLAERDPSRRVSLEAILRNTANATCLVGSPSINTLPGSASVDIDGRLAPGQSAEDLIRELEGVLSPFLRPDDRLEVLQGSPSVSFPTGTPLYRAIEQGLATADPGCHVVPSLVPGFTDSRNYARLGATCYGFYPLRLPVDLDFAALFHGDDERIPVAGFHWGIEVLHGVLARFLADGEGESTHPNP